MEIGRKVEAQDLRNYIFQKAAYSVEIPPAPLDKGREYSFSGEKRERGGHRGTIGLPRLRSGSHESGTD